MVAQCKPNHVCYTVVCLASCDKLSGDRAWRVWTWINYSSTTTRSYVLVINISEDEQSNVLFQIT